jgi:hypothetical protein
MRRSRAPANAALDGVAEQDRLEEAVIVARITCAADTAAR